MAIDRSLLLSPSTKPDLKFRFHAHDKLVVNSNNKDGKPVLKPVFKGWQDFAPVLGVELEVSFKPTAHPETATHVKALMDNFVICKSDGSIGNDGIEIVSSPATLKYHKHDAKWKEFFEAHKDHIVDGYERCGIHIHINKMAFTPMTMGKFVTFFHLPANAQFLYKVAGRAESSYAVVRGNEMTKVGWLSKEQNMKSGTKYSAANIVPEHTIEIRLFASTINPDLFFKNIEFVYNVWRFVEDTSLSKLGHADFVEWVTKNPCEDNYYLRKFLGIGCKRTLDAAVKYKAVMEQAAKMGGVK